MSQGRRKGDLFIFIQPYEWRLSGSRRHSGRRNLLQRWTGGVPPYTVQSATNPLTAGWQNLGSPTSLTNWILVPSNAGMFYRIQSQ